MPRFLSVSIRIACDAESFEQESEAIRDVLCEALAAKLGDGWVDRVAMNSQEADA